VVATVSPVVQTGNRVAVTVAGVNTEAPAAAEVTLYRDDLLVDRVPVRSWNARAYSATIANFVALDHEAPLARPVFYVLEVTRTDGTVVERTGGPVTIAADHPIVSDPITGSAVVLGAVEQWPELTRDSRGSTIAVAGRPDPVVITGPIAFPSSSPILRTDTWGDLLALRALLATGQVLQIRAPETGVEDAYLGVSKHVEARITNRADDLRRRHSLESQHVAMPQPDRPAVADTLQDIADAFPAPLTLTDISVTYPTLLALAAADLEAV